MPVKSTYNNFPLFNGMLNTKTIDETVTRQQVIDCYLKHNKIVPVVNELKLFFDVAPDQDDDTPEMRQSRGHYRNYLRLRRMTREDIEHHFKVDLHLERSKSINRWLMKSFPDSVGAERAIKSGVY